MVGLHRQMAAKQDFPKTKSHNVFGQPRSKPKMFRAGLYARVSTNDQHTLPMQIRAQMIDDAIDSLNILVMEGGHDGARRIARSITSGAVLVK